MMSSTPAQTHNLYPESPQYRYSPSVVPSLLSGTYDRQTEVVRGDNLTQGDAL